MEINLTASYKDLTGKYPTWHEVEQWIHPLPTSSTLYFLSKLNAALAEPSLGSQQVQLSVLLSSLAQQNPQTVYDLLQRGRFFFYPHQVLAAMNLVLLWGQQESENTPLRKLNLEEVNRVITALIAITNLPDFERKRQLRRKVRE